MQTIYLVSKRHSLSIFILSCSSWQFLNLVESIFCCFIIFVLIERISFYSEKFVFLVFHLVFLVRATIFLFSSIPAGGNNCSIYCKAFILIFNLFLLWKPFLQYSGLKIFHFFSILASENEVSVVEVTSEY